MRWARFATLAAIVLASAGAHADAEPDALEAYRDTFRRGMERYKAGAIAEAIPYWENVYRELGAAKGYRVAYNLARAHEALGDSTRAAERYEAFLAEVDARRAAKEAIEPLVEKQEVESRARLAELAATRGRIRIVPGPIPVAAQIDGADARPGIVTYVAPGSHVVVFSPGTKDAERKALDVRAGESVDVSPPRLAEAAPSPAVAAPVVVPEPPPASPPLRVLSVERPFSPTLLYVAGGATLAAGALTAITYATALSEHGAYTSANADEQLRIEGSYPGTKSLAYVSLGVTVTLAAATGALVGWYFLGAKERVSPSASISPAGASLGITGRF